VVIVSESKGKVNLFHEALTGSGTAVGSILGSGTTLHAVKVMHHLSTDTNLAGDRQTFASANSMGSSLAIVTLNRSHSSAATVLRVALHGLTLTGTTGTKAGNGDFLTSGVQIGSDSGEVGNGSGHGSVSVDLRVL